MRTVEEEANLYRVWVKIVHSDGFQINVRGCEGDSFHVLAYYGVHAPSSAVKGH